MTGTGTGTVCKKLEKFLLLLNKFSVLRSMLSFHLSGLVLLALGGVLLIRPESFQLLTNGNPWISSDVDLVLRLVSPALGMLGTLG